MGNSSIHIQRATAGSAGHNSREHYSYSVVFSDEKNECTTPVAEAYKTYRSELAIRSKAYTERTGQKLQKKAVTQLSAVVNLEQHHTLKDLEPIKAELERLFDTKVYQMAIHRDEGKLVSKADGTELYSGKDFFMNPENSELFFDKKFSKPVPMDDYKIVKNYHAHIEMMGLDSKGNAIRQKMNKVALQGLQTTVAKTLQMERGKQREGYTKEEMKQILNVVGKKSDYENTTLYAQKFNEVAKELGIYKESDKRKDTHQFKDDGAEREKGKRQALATQKELKAEIAKLREQLQLAGAGRAEYAALEQINRELKEQIKAKDLTISDLKTALEASKATKEVSTPQTVEIDAPDKEQINKIGDRLQRVATYTADQIIETSSIERKGIVGTKKEIDVPTLRANITTVLDQHNELHRETWGIIKKLNEVKEKILDGAKNVVESSKTALKTIFSLGEGKSLSEEKKSVETPEEAKERIQKFLAEQKAKKQSRGMSL